MTRLLSFTDSTECKIKGTESQPAGRYGTHLWCLVFLLIAVQTSHSQFNTIRIEKTVDFNGNGIREAGDINPLPPGVIAVFETKKNGSHLRFDTLGNGVVTAIQINNLDSGQYSVKETGIPSG